MWPNASGFFNRYLGYLANYHLTRDDVIFPIDKAPEIGSIAILRGNIAEEGSVINYSACVKEMLHHKGPARVFECEEDAIAAIKGGKISAEVLEKALKKFVEEIEKSQKQASQPKTYRGKQSIKHLVEQNAAISNIEVTDGNIKAFERIANKYGIDYALKKDTSEQPPRYLVFFKGRDVDVMTQAFKEFSAKKLLHMLLPLVDAVSNCRYPMVNFDFLN